MPPAIAVQVIGPGERQVDLDPRVHDFLRAGTKLMWVVDPDTESVRIHRPANAAMGTISELSGSETITGEDVLPGFTCRVGEFFDI